MHVYMFMYMHSNTRHTQINSKEKIKPSIHVLCKITYTLYMYVCMSHSKNEFSRKLHPIHKSSLKHKSTIILKIKHAVISGYIDVLSNIKWFVSIFNRETPFFNKTITYNCSLGVLKKMVFLWRK